MRFLINSALATKPKLTNNRASLISPPLTGTPSSASPTVLVTSGDAATKVKKKWGQQCGVSCGCVVRFEIDLDDRDRVVSAEYTAQRILMATATSRTYQQQQKDSNNLKRLQPLLTNRTGRMQYQPSNCKALHRLSACAVNYFVNRPLWQIMNYHEFQHSRSSEAFRQAVLTAQNLNPSDTQTNNVRSAEAHLNKKRNSQPVNHNHCFDLVEDAITALLKGYVPPPRNRDHQLTQYLNENSGSSFNMFDLYDDENLSRKDEAMDEAGMASYSPIPWHERKLSIALTEIPNLLSWRKSSADEPDDDAVIVFVSSGEKESHDTFPSNDSGRSAPRWTALDWMDWFDNDREKHQEQIQIREKKVALEKMNRLSGSLSYISHATDWLTYVDAIQLDGTKSEQSA
jgi:hypothetical protein